MARKALPATVRGRLSPPEGGSFDEGGVNQYGIVHGLYLCQNMSLVYFDLCVHGSSTGGTSD